MHEATQEQTDAHLKRNHGCSKSNAALTGSGMLAHSCPCAADASQLRNISLLEVAAPDAAVVSISGGQLTDLCRQGASFKPCRFRGMCSTVWTFEGRGNLNIAGFYFVLGHILVL